MFFHLVHLVLSMGIYTIKHYSTEVEKQNRFYEKNELCIILIHEKGERIVADEVDPELLAKVLANPEMRALLNLLAKTMK